MEPPGIGTSGGHSAFPQGKAFCYDRRMNSAPTPDRSMGASEAAKYPELRASDLGTSQQLRRRTILPIVLFVATCLSTFYVGAADWRPQDQQTYAQMGQVIQLNWQQGLIYMGAVLAILLTHEMGHF